MRRFIRFIVLSLTWKGFMIILRTLINLEMLLGRLSCVLKIPTVDSNWKSCNKIKRLFKGSRTFYIECEYCLNLLKFKYHFSGHKDNFLLVPKFAALQSELLEGVIERSNWYTYYNNNKIITFLKICLYLNRIEHLHTFVCLYDNF